MNMTVRTPFFEDLFDFRRDFDKIFNRMLTTKPWEENFLRDLFGFVPAVEAYIDKEAKKYVCKVLCRESSRRRYRFRCRRIC